MAESNQNDEERITKKLLILDENEPQPRPKFDCFQRKIREELSSMSFEELQKLKQKLGTKVYNEAVHGSKKAPKRKFKRVNKNRPREMSSKTPVPEVGCSSKKMLPPRDPRFDGLCGEYNEKAFKSAYGFVSGYRKSEVQQLKEELIKCDDPERKDQIKYLIQRMENQLREEQRRKEKAQKEKEEYDSRVEAAKRGEKIRYRSKSEKKVVELVDRFEDLKKSGGLKKHMEKYRKKILVKDRKKMSADPSFR